MSDAVLHRLECVLRDVFKQPDMPLDATTTARDVPGWDSLGHINLVLALEAEFGVRLRATHLARLASLGEVAEHLRQRVG